MEPILNAKPFEILVTHVEKEHGLVKIFGQVDLKTSQVRKGNAGYLFSILSLCGGWWWCILESKVT